MAYITAQEDDEQKKQAELGGGGASFAGGGAGQAAPMAGGKGGQKQFANIQSYLGANQGSDFDQMFQGAAGKELSDITSASQAKTGPAESQFSSEKARTDFDPNKQLGSLMQAADYGQDYKPIAQNIRGLLQTQFAAPQFQKSNEAESAKRYGQYLASPQAFGSLSGQAGMETPFLSSMYRGGASPLTQGQMALQQQIDVGRGASFEPAKQKLLNQYADYQKAIGKEGTLLNDIGAAKSDFGTRQTGLRTALEQALAAQGSPNYISQPGAPAPVGPTSVGPDTRNVGYTPGSNTKGPGQGKAEADAAEVERKRNERRLAAIRAALYGE